MREKTTGFAWLVLTVTLATIAAESSKISKTTAMCYMRRDKLDGVEVVNPTQ